MLFGESAWSHAVLLLFTTIVSACLSPILNADEAYGYWEPLHILLYGRGSKTWPYDRQFGLGSYTFLALHLVFVKPLSWLFTDELLVFRLTRLSIGLLGVACHLRLTKQLAKRYGTTCANVALFLYAVLPGTQTARIALLPHSWAMHLVVIALSSYLAGYDNQTAIVAFIIGVLTWPQASIYLLVPLTTTTNSLFRSKGGQFMRVSDVSWIKRVEILLYRWTALLGFGSIYVLLPSLIIERKYYGLWTFPALNALIHSLFGQDEVRHAAAVPQYRGLHTLLMAMNLTVFLALSGLPGSDWTYKKLFWGGFLAILFLAPQMHKGEHVLYPLYPTLIILASIVISRRARSLRYLILGMITLLSLWRVTTLVPYNRTPASLFVATRDLTSNATVCMADDWNLFPSSFFIGPGTKLGFMRNTFTGALPVPLDSEGEIGPTKDDSQNTAIDQSIDGNQCDFFMGTPEEAEKLLPGHRPTLCRDIITGSQPSWGRAPLAVGIRHKRWCLYQKK